MVIRNKRISFDMVRVASFKVAVYLVQLVLSWRVRWRVESFLFLSLSLSYLSLLSLSLSLSVCLSLSLFYGYSEHKSQRSSVLDLKEGIKIWDAG